MNLRLAYSLKFSHSDPQAILLVPFCDRRGEYVNEYERSRTAGAGAEGGESVVAGRRTGMAAMEMKGCLMVRRGLGLREAAVGETLGASNASFVEVCVRVGDGREMWGAMEEGLRASSDSRDGWSDK